MIEKLKLRCFLLHVHNTFAYNKDSFILAQKLTEVTATGAIYIYTDGTK